MLVLRRTVGEEIVIGDDIVITILKVSTDRVKVGISAPRSTSVHRREVYEIVRKNRQKSDAKIEEEER